MTSSTTYRTHPEDLTAQKVNLSALLEMQTTHLLYSYNLRTDKHTVNENNMDIGIAAAIAMIVGWAVVTFTTEAPGYVHLLLTIGFFLLFWRISVRGARRNGRGA